MSIAVNPQAGGAANNVNQIAQSTSSSQISGSAVSTASVIPHSLIDQVASAANKVSADISKLKNDQTTDPASVSSDTKQMNDDLASLNGLYHGLGGPGGGIVQNDAGKDFISQVDGVVNQATQLGSSASSSTATSTSSGNGSDFASPTIISADQWKQMADYYKATGT